MKRMGRTIAIAALIWLLAACSSSESALVGDWVQRSGERPNSRLVLADDGTGSLRVQGGVRYEIESWRVATDQHLELTIEGEAVLSRYQINDRTLIISRSDKFKEMDGTYAPAG